MMRPQFGSPPFHDDLTRADLQTASFYPATYLTVTLGVPAGWIAATALVYGAKVVGRDAAFVRVPRLDYVQL